MYRIRIVAIGLFSALMFTAGDSPQGGTGHAQELRPAGGHLVGKLAQASRPLHIEDADASIVTATIRGPEFGASNLFLGVEDPANSDAKRLREEYRLDDVVEGETNEFRKLLKLRHWVHSRWHIDNDQRFNGDVFSILEKAKSGEGFNCSHAMKVQHAVLTAMGFVVRDLGVQCNTEEFPDGFHHGVNEVWSNDYAKWVLMDGEYDFHFERDGQVLSALESYEAARSDGGRGVVKVQGPDRTVVPMKGPGFPFTSVIGYWWTAYHVRQNTFTQPSGNESRLVIFDDAAFRQTTWYRMGGDNVLRKHWAYDAKAFIPTSERQQIEWTPGVPDLRVRQTAPAELEVRINSVTPNLKTINVRTNGGEWQTLKDDRLDWKLRAGDNRLEVRTRNILDVDGPLVTADVTLKRTWTPELMMHVKSIGSVQVSPDGGRVAFTVSEAVMQNEKSEYLSHIHLTNAEGADSRQLTQGDHSCDSPQWSPDGRWIAFLSQRTEKKNLWLIPVDGGEAQQLTDVKTGVSSFLWSPDGRWIAFTAMEPPTPEEEKSVEEKNDARVVDEEVKMDCLHVLPVILPLDGKPQARVLTTGKYSVGSRGLRSGRPSYDWSPDSQKLVFTHTRTPQDDDWPSADISLVDLTTAAVQPLVQTNAAEFSPLFSPDGRWIAYVASDDPPRWAGAGRLHVVSASGGSPKPLADTVDGFSRYSDLIGWSADNRQIFFTELQGTVLTIGGMPLEGEPTEIGRLTGRGSNVHLNANRQKFGLSSESSEKPVEVFVSPVDRFQPIQVSEVNRDLTDVPLGRTEVIRWKSTDGLEIEGLLTYPIDFAKGQRYPLLLIAHGGPMGAFTQEFIGASGPYPMAVLADLGYAVLRPNIRGSSGYGQKFRYANRGDWGGMDYEDLMAGVDQVIDLGVADPDRLGIMGWSYGGFMTSWVITQTRRFKAASVGAGVTNLMSFTGATDIPGFLPDYFSSYFWDDLKTYRAHSPMFHVKGVTTPTLIQHGERDKRVPLSQGQELYDALKSQGCEVKMVVYPRSGHGITEPRLMLDAMKRNIEWFERYIGRGRTDSHQK